MRLTPEAAYPTSVSLLSSHNSSLNRLGSVPLCQPLPSQRGHHTIPKGVVPFLCQSRGMTSKSLWWDHNHGNSSMANGHAVWLPRNPATKLTFKPSVGHLVASFYHSWEQNLSAEMPRVIVLRGYELASLEPEERMFHLCVVLLEKWTSTKGTRRNLLLVREIGK